MSWRPCWKNGATGADGPGMKFWDSSAVMPLLVEERASARFARIHAADPEIVVWWATEVECVSALASVVLGE